MVRTCQPELLDHLPVDDPGALQSRRDLRRVNAWMGNARFMAGALNAFLPKGSGRRILEIGAGDGTFFLEVARRLHTNPCERTILFLDRQNLVQPKTRAEFEKLGWHGEPVCSDVFRYLQSQTDATAQTSPTLPAYDAIIANLFLHHFSNEQLAELFRLAEKQTSLFIAIEPRRSLLSLFAGKLLWAIGCNFVTRHDALISIRAGFGGHELSDLWPKSDAWICEERPAGFSSHLFIASRRTDPL